MIIYLNTFLKKYLKFKNVISVDELVENVLIIYKKITLQLFINYTILINYSQRLY